MRVPTSLLGRRSGMRLALAVLLAAGAGAAAAGAPLHPRGAAADGLGAVAEVLRHRGVSDDRGEEEIVAELVDLGNEYVPALFSLCTGEDLQRLLDSAADATAWQTSPDRLTVLARRALQGLPADQVIEHLEGRTGPRAPLEHRLEALRVVAGLRSSLALELVLRVAEEAGPLALRYRSVRTPLVEALSATLGADDGAWQRLRKEVDDHAPAVLRVLLEAVRASARPEGMDVLAELLGYVPELDPEVVTAIGELHDRFPWLVPRDGRELVRPLLYSRDPEVRAAAVHALATMGDQESFESVAELLHDDDARVRWAAQRSLQVLSDTRLPADVGAWLAWYDAQHLWWRTRSSELVAQLGDRDVGRALTAVRELGGRPLFRHEAAELLAGSLWSQRPELAAATCLALEKLGSRRAVPGLVDRLSNRQGGEQARSAALRALRQLTGEELPPDNEAWEAYVNGDGPVPTPRRRES